jgi:hypothetical protein
MNYVFLLTTCWFLSFSDGAQTTICKINGDSVFAGSTNRALIHSARQFNFVCSPGIDGILKPIVNKLAMRCPNFKMLSDSTARTIKELFTEFYMGILQSDPVHFDRDIMRGEMSIRVGQVCLFGYENAKPILLDIVFYMNKGVRHPVVVSYSVSAQPMAFLSEQSPNFKGIVGNLDKGGGVIQVKRQIVLWTKGRTDAIGPAVDVLVVTKSGTQWVRL